MMRRREALALLVAAVSATRIPSLGAAAQPATAGKTQRVGVVSPADAQPALAMLRTRLGELGHAEGRDIVWVPRHADGQVDQLPALAEDLVRDRIDAIVAESTPAAVAAHRATTTIPIVALVGVDPVGSGLVASLARPGSNVTGVALLAEEMNAKRLELLREAFPHLRRVGVAGTSAFGLSRTNLGAVQEAGRALGLTVDPIPIDDPGDFGRALSPAALAGFDGFILTPDVALITHRAELTALLGATGRPAVYVDRAWARSGGLMSLGPDIADIYRRLASQLDRVLRGTRPSELPFELPTKLEFVINLPAARTSGIEILPSILARADEVLE
jgi:putative ABC transport system substrate-binding protein